MNTWRLLFLIFSFLGSSLPITSQAKTSELSTLDCAVMMDILLRSVKLASKEASMGLAASEMDSLAHDTMLGAYSVTEYLTDAGLKSAVRESSNKVMPLLRDKNSTDSLKQKVSFCISTLKEFRTLISLDKEPLYRTAFYRFQSVTGNEIYRFNLQASASSPLNGAGTGFFVNSQGYLITNYHVVRNSKKLFILHPKFIKPLDARLLHFDDALDLAVLKVDYSTPYMLLSVKEPSFNQNLYALGFPSPTKKGIDHKIESGRLLDILGPFGDFQRMQTSVHVESGNSGGPLFDSSGTVMGVIFGKSKIGQQGDVSEKRGLASFSVKSFQLMEFLNEHNIPYHLDNSNSTPDVIPASIAEDLKTKIVLILSKNTD